MSEGTKVPYSEAKEIADSLLELLGGHFKRLEIAGSLRRKKEFIGDIKLVGILQLTPDKGSLFAAETPPIEAITNPMKVFGYEAEKVWGKYIKFVSSRINAELFLCTPETWGCTFLIRTGSVEFTRKMVTRRASHGWCPDNMYFRKGRLWSDKGVLQTPEEADVFKETGMTFVSPEQRSL